MFNQFVKYVSLLDHGLPYILKLLVYSHVGFGIDVLAHNSSMFDQQIANDRYKMQDIWCEYSCSWNAIMHSLPLSLWKVVV